MTLSAMDWCELEASDAGNCLEQADDFPDARAIGEFALMTSRAFQINGQFAVGQIVPEQLSELAEFYWCTDLPTKEIAKAYDVHGGASAIWRAAGPGILCGIFCNSCGGILYIRSRSQATATKEAIRQRLDIICEGCAKHEESLRWKEHELAVQSEREYQHHLKHMPYREYLQTEHWNSVRKSALRRAKYRCSLCYAQKPLQVHHRTYERRGNEWPEDLIALCGSCHSSFHKKLKIESASHHGVRSPNVPVAPQSPNDPAGEQ